MTKKKIETGSKLFHNLLRTTEQFISGKGFNPLTLEELMVRLHLPTQHLAIFTEVLEALVKQGTICQENDRYSLRKEEVEYVTGIIRMHPRGFGFVQPDNTAKYPEDIFIPKPLTQNAVDGDHVQALINTEVFSEKGPEGKVVSILSRGRSHIGGIVRAIEKYGDVIVYAPLLGLQQRVIVQAKPEAKLKVGDRIVMEVLEWGSKDSETVGLLSNHVGHISDPSCDIRAAIAEFELNDSFPPEAVKEAQSFGTKVTAKEIADREDIREMECFTIDPDTAKDFDDALTLTKDRSGYHLGVHIADVSHYVSPNSALDLEAQERCNSTYFPNFCLPMLPPELSENLCSLKPNVNRLTLSVFMDFDAEGNLKKHRIARTVIYSAKRFTYREAKKVLDGEKESPHQKTLHLMVELCQLLKKKRYERGSLEFAMPELVVKVDEQGVPFGTDYIAYDVTHQMVEEFMLKANEMVALDLSEKGKDITYRVHDVPAEENMKDFAILANAFGFKVSDTPTPKELQELFDEAMETPHGQYLATSYIRRMRLAVYSADNIGHYGLGLTHYCHFTSPIRRYVDLVVHRILCGEETSREKIEAIAAKCSDQERISAKAEGSVVTLKKLRMLKTMQEQDPHKLYSAIITRVKNFGFFFEVIDLMLEGFLHVSELHDDYFVFEESKMRLRGSNSGLTFSTGEKIEVILKEVDFITSESSWYLGTSKEATEQPSGKRSMGKRSMDKPPGRKPPKSSKKPLPSEKRKSARGRSRKR
jgi:ribonuclease R